MAPKPPTVIIRDTINIIIKKYGAHSDGHSSSRIKLTTERYEMIKLAWIQGLKRGQFPEMDKAIDVAIGIKWALGIRDIRDLCCLIVERLPLID